MALMPLFKYHASTGIGQKLYQRMNMPGNELDMIAFKSAVKVGGKKYAPNVVEKFKIKQDAAKEGITQDKLDNAVSSIDNSLTKLSDVSIDYASGLENRAEDPSNTLAVSVQDIKDLRLQLNTHAHEHFDRSMGTQMAKLAFSNVIDAAMYGNKTGRDIKHDINTMIEALCEKGVVAIRDRFYKEVTDPKTKETKRVIDTSKVADFIKEVAESQGFGTNADDILRQSNCLESLTNRTVFEQAMSKLVNKNVVDIVTNGGTAVQQSVYTFAGSNVQTQGFEGYRSFNNGKELKWITKDNSMEVLLSMNFFKPVVPKEH